MDHVLSDGLSTEEQGRQFAVLGGQYDTDTFTLATGKETADKGGVYDFVIYEENEKGRGSAFFYFVKIRLTSIDKYITCSLDSDMY